MKGIRDHLKPILIGLLAAAIGWGILTLAQTAVRDHYLLQTLLQIEMQRERAGQGPGAK